MDSTLVLTSDMKIVLGLVALTMVLFIFERIRGDLVALVVLVLLGLTGQIASEDIFNGFSSNAVISIISTMILGAGLDRTGALNRLAAWLLRRAKNSEHRLIALTSTIAGLNSSFMQNPSVMALYLPVASRLSSRTNVSLARLVFPIAAAIVMGGSLTMVGTSPLILLNDLLVATNANLPSGLATLKPLNMFTTLPIGLALLLLSLAYFRFYGDKLLSKQETSKGTTPARTQSYFANTYGIEGDLYELTVTAESPLVGMSLIEIEALPGAPTILALKTNNESRLAPPGDLKIWVNSVIGVMGPRQQVTDFAQNQFLHLSSRLRQFGDLFNPSRAGIAEAVIPPTSTFIGKTSADLHLRRKHGLSLLAINRNKEVIVKGVRQIPIQSGDMLVLHSIWQDLAKVAENRDFVIVTDFPKGEQRPHKFKIAMTIFAVSMLLALSSKIPTSIALMAGVCGMLLSGVIKMDEAYNAISWKTVFTMACLIPLGWAMDSSGAAAWIANHTIEQLPTGLPVWILMLAVAFLTTAFSMAVTHVGATIVMVPLAINLALAADGNPTAFALTVALSASNNFMTGSNPVMSMITGPANYSAMQMWRVGLPLSFLYTLVVAILISVWF